VNDYINNGLASNNIDPDGGINIQKKSNALLQMKPFLLMDLK
jgi:hypothetical protein